MIDFEFCGWGDARIDPLKGETVFQRRFYENTNPYWASLSYRGLTGFLHTTEQSSSLSKVTLVNTTQHICIRKPEHLKDLSFLA